MTADEIRTNLARLGWSGADAARVLGVTETTVSAWRTGKWEVPGPVAAYFGLRLRVERLIDGLGEELNGGS